MRLGRNRLEAGILELFKIACADSRPMLAEHLLLALEAIDAAGVPCTGGTGRSALAEAHRKIAEGDFGSSDAGCEGPP